TSQLRRSRRLWRVLFFLALAVAALAVAGRFVLDNGATGQRIARINVDGTIATDPARLQVLRELADDPLVEAVLVSINSPGGTTAGGEELFEALGVLRAEKPVVAVIHELGASAAYMTAIGSDHIFARRLSIVGSIGVLYQHVNAGKLLDTTGIDLYMAAIGVDPIFGRRVCVVGSIAVLYQPVTPGKLPDRNGFELDKVATGPLKAEPDLDEPITPLVGESLQSFVADSDDWFVDIVVE